MPIQFTDRKELKQVVKQALLELIQEEPEVWYALFAEVIEDLALVNAIKEGENSEMVNREKVIDLITDKDVGNSHTN
jgi:hypothetical protein